MTTARFTVRGFRLARKPYIADDFNRANGPVGAPPLGQVVQEWEQPDGYGFVIIDGSRARAEATTSSTATNVRVLQQIGTPDFYIEAVLGSQGTFGLSAMPDPGFIARWTDTANYLRLEFNSTNGFRLRNVGGGGANAVLHSSGVKTWDAGDVLSLRLVGDQARYTIGGQSFDVPVPNNLTGTKAGLIAKASDTMFGGTFDAFKVEIGDAIPAL